MGLRVAVCACPPPRPRWSHRAARGHPTWKPVAGLRRTSPRRPTGLRQGQIAVSPKLVHGQAWGSRGDALRALLAVWLPRERRPSRCPAPNCQDRKLLPAARLRGALVPLLTCPRRCLAGLSLPLWGLLWEFPALLLWGGCLKAAWIIWLWLNQASNKWQRGRTHSLLLFDSCKHRV